MAGPDRPTIGTMTPGKELVLGVTLGGRAAFARVERGGQVAPPPHFPLGRTGQPARDVQGRIGR